MKAPQPITLEDVVAEIVAERKYAAVKWPRGETGTPIADEHAFGEWILYGDQYLAEAKALASHEPGNNAARVKLLKAVQLFIYALQNRRSTTTEHAETLYVEPV